MRRLLQKIDSLKPLTKTAMVIGLYIAAFLMALAVAMIYDIVSSYLFPDPSDGMKSFGIFLLFLFVLGVTLIFPTGLCLIILRKSRLFWGVCLVVSLLITTISLLSILAAVTNTHLKGLDQVWLLAFFVSPFLCISNAVAAWFSMSSFKWIFGFAAFEACLCGAIGAAQWIMLVPTQ